MVASLFSDTCDLSLTERTLFTLFTKYPEITFDFQDTKVADVRVAQVEQAEPLSSSPISGSEGDNATTRSPLSTAYTTPLRPTYHQQQSHNDTETVAGYLRQIRHTNLPEECRLCFMSLAQSIGAISAGMVPSTNGRYRINNTYFMDQCAVLLRELQSLSSRTKEQVKSVSNLTSLIVFTSTPSDDMLWAIYRQRAQLIIKLAALPSHDENKLIQRLAHLYNNVIYTPVQHLLDDGEIEPPTMRILNKLYNLFFTWSSDYKQWCRAMQHLKQQYMTPLVDRMLVSEVIRADVKDMRQAKSKADVALKDPKGPSMLPVDEKVLQQLNLSARRQPAALKRKSRFRREKTI